MLIKPALRKHGRHRPSSWQEVPHGRFLCNAERQALAPYWATMAGDYALHLGPLSQGVVSGCRAREQVVIDQGDKARVQANLDALPIRRHSVDIISMAHVLEFAQDPHQLLREADRALAFDGYLVLTLYNPLSLAHLAALALSMVGRTPPQGAARGRPFTKARVEDWLALLNYEVQASGYVGNSALWPRRKVTGVETDNPLCRRVPLLRCAYYLVARKRVFPLTPSPGFIRFSRPLSAPSALQTRVKDHRTRNI